jgi:hypothetical protein
MMPSSPIHHRADTRHSGRLSPGSTPACVGSQDWPVLAPQIVWPNVRSSRSPRHARPTLRGKTIKSVASRQTPRHSPRGQIPIAPAQPPVPHSPRFRALALFGRRLYQCVGASPRRHPKTCT